jgi:N-succinyldiaminopimelate aminotransferase
LNIKKYKLLWFFFGKKLAEDREILQPVFLPRSYLSREVDGINLTKGWIRMALVAELNECIEAANRIVIYLLKNS